MLEKTRRQVRFDQTISSPFRSQTHERFMRGELLVGLGHLEEALPWFRSFEGSSIYDVIYIAPSQFRRGEIFERLGQIERAAEHYNRGIALWSECDQELRALREDAKQRLRRLRKRSS